MAILIFARPEARLASSSRRLALFLALALVALVTPIATAQHIVTAAARTQADTLFQQAYTTYQAGDYPQAHHLIDEAEKLNPDQADGWNLRGAVFLKQQMYPQATAAFARAVKLDPKLWAAQFNLGEVPFHQKDYRLARERFEALLSQTDRFKEANRWELAAYKAYLSTLLMGDDTNARKKLAKLPAKGATPAYLYAQAALSFSRKDVTTAQKTLAAAQSAYPPAANDLFASSFVTIGWTSEAPVLPPYNPPMSQPGAAPYAASGGEKPMQIDPRLEAAVADPLPSPGAAVYGKVPAVTRGAPDGQPAQKAGQKAPATLKQPKAPSPAPDADHSGLLLE